MSKRNCFLSKRCPNCRTGWAGSHPPVLPGTAPSGPLPGLGSEGAFSGQISDSNNERYNGQILITSESDAELTTKLARTCYDRRFLWSSGLRTRLSQISSLRTKASSCAVAMRCSTFRTPKNTVIQKCYMKNASSKYGADFCEAFFPYWDTSHAGSAATSALGVAVPGRSPSAFPGAVAAPTAAPASRIWFFYMKITSLSFLKLLKFVELYRTSTRQLEHRLKHQLKFWYKNIFEITNT